jgi:hypothetical protein
LPDQHLGRIEFGEALADDGDVGVGEDDRQRRAATEAAQLGRRGVDAGDVAFVGSFVKQGRMRPLASPARKTGRSAICRVFGLTGGMPRASRGTPRVSRPMPAMFGRLPMAATTLVGDDSHAAAAHFDAVACR